MADKKQPETYIINEEKVLNRDMKQFIDLYVGRNFYYLSRANNMGYVNFYEFEQNRKGRLVLKKIGANVGHRFEDGVGRPWISKSDTKNNSEKFDLISVHFDDDGKVLKFETDYHIKSKKPKFFDIVNDEYIKSKLDAIAHP